MWFGLVELVGVHSHLHIQSLYSVYKYVCIETVTNKLQHPSKSHT